MSAVGCLLAQTSAQTSLSLSSWCRYFCDELDVRHHVCTRVTKDMSQQKCHLTQVLSLAPNPAAALSFELIQWMSRELELSQNYDREMYLRNCNLFAQRKKLLNSEIKPWCALSKDKCIFNSILWETRIWCSWRERECNCSVVVLH